jgi:hypothetical protein
MNILFNNLHSCLYALLTTTALLGSIAWAAEPFVDNNDGTVTDTSTGLMWDKCSLGQSGNNCSTGSATTHTWGDAQIQAATKNGIFYKNYGDWRVPNLAELRSLMQPAFPRSFDTSVFPSTDLTSYIWSASSSDTPDYNFPGSNLTLAATHGRIFSITHGSGEAPKTFPYGVRLVRMGQYLGAFGLSNFSVSGVTQYTASLTATSPVGATGYWMVVPRAAAMPLASEIIAGATSYRGVTVAAHGSGAMVAASATNFSISGLNGGTSYDLYLVAEETATQTSAVIGSLAFSTAATATSSIVVHPNVPGTLFAGLDSGGVYTSSNGGANWIALNTGLSNLSVKALAIKSDASRLFAGTEGSGVFFGAGSGSWTPCGSLPGGIVNIRSLTWSGSTLYAGSTGGVFASTDGCATWAAMNTGLPN